MNHDMKADVELVRTLASDGAKARSGQRQPAGAVRHDF
jgi:hypothetical protein